MNKYKETMAEFEKTKPSAYKHRKRVLTDALVKTIISGGISIAAPCVAFNDRPIVMISLAIVFGIVFPLMIVKPWKILHKNFAGNIVSIEPYMKRVGVPSATNSTVAMGDALYIKILVDDGEKKHEFEMPAEYGMAYKPGDKILSTSGIKFPLNMTPHENDICACCGNMMPESKDTCMICGFINE